MKNSSDKFGWSEDDITFTESKKVYHSNFTIKNLTVSGWEFLPDEIRENLEIMKIYKPAVKNQINLEKKQVDEELGGIKWDAGDTKTQYWANARSVYLEDINTSTFNVARDAIDSTVKEGLAKGLTPTEMAKEIKRAVHDVYEVRLGRPVTASGNFDLGGMSSSTTIARTEMGSIASLTRNDIFRSEGIQKIEWVTSMDDKVRDSHAALDGSVTTMGETFGNGLRYPRDPNGDAGEIINCRCAFIAVVD
jgi:SPP1 gp7 family putative phage head morphogenesis protein